MSEKFKGADFKESPTPVETGNPHKNRKADNLKVGDINPDESVSKKCKRGEELPSSNITEDVVALFESAGLSEDFVSKATVIFEGAVNERVSDIREALESDFEEALSESIEAVKGSLEESINDYLQLFVEHYLEQNKIAITSGFRAHITEEIVDSIRTVVESAGVTLDETQVDLADALMLENSELEEKYNEAINETLEIRRELQAMRAEQLFEQNTVGLSEASKERLRKLTEGIEYETLEQYSEKLEILKESISGATKTTTGTDINQLNESVDRTRTQPSSAMASYLSAAAYDLY